MSGCDNMSPANLEQVGIHVNTFWYVYDNTVAHLSSLDILVLWQNPSSSSPVDWNLQTVVPIQFFFFFLISVKEMNYTDSAWWALVLNTVFDVHLFRHCIDIHYVYRPNCSQPLSQPWNPKILHYVNDECFLMLLFLKTRARKVSWELP
jgi:hypothetical protein